MRYDFADKILDRDKIQQVWQACFPDSEEVIDYYIKQRMDEQTMAVLREDGLLEDDREKRGRIVSMASFLPVCYEKQGQLVPARYVYAVGTLPEYRGQGYAEKLICQAMEHFKTPLILVPASKKLEQYYGRMGFRKAFQEGKIQFTQQELTGEVAVNDEILPNNFTAHFTVQSISAAEYKERRDAAWNGDGFVCWDEKSVQFAMDLYSFFGGGAVKVVQNEAPGKIDILLYTNYQQRLDIAETTMTEMELRQFLPIYTKQIGAKSVHYRLPGGMIWLPEIMKSDAEILKDGYLNLHLN